jgi:hypothetical protein
LDGGREALIQIRGESPGSRIGDVKHVLHGRVLAFVTGTDYIALSPILRKIPCNSDSPLNTRRVLRRIVV